MFGVLRFISISMISWPLPMRFGLICTVVVAAGCATHVQVFPDNESFSRNQTVSRGVPQPWWNDPKTSTVLRTHGLEKVIQANPELALERLHEAASTSTNVDEITDTVALTLQS